MRIALRVLPIAALLLAGAARAEEVSVAPLAYEHDGAPLEGLLARPASVPDGARVPGVLVVHDWMGVGPYVRRRAEMLARLGYVALAADVYGKGVRPKDRDEASAQAGKFRADRALLRARVRAGLDALRRVEGVDPARIVAIGYCFGGGAALELARGGADLAGVVSFHGNLDTPDPDDAKAIRAKVLVLHGADDPFVPPPHVLSFQEEMRAAKVDWQMIHYGGAVHAFTHADVGDDPSRGAAYHEPSDRRSWAAMLQFFQEVFGG